MALRITNLESLLDDLRKQVDWTMKIAQSVTRDLKKAQVSVVHGNLRDLARTRQTLAAHVESLTGAVGEFVGASDVDAVDYLESGEFADELCAAAATADLNISCDNTQILCYPSIARIEPDEIRLEIDRGHEYRLRPSTVVGVLAARQEQAPRLNPELFLNSLCSAYDLVIAHKAKKPGAIVRLTDILSVLTLLPGSGLRYTEQEFVRDLYSLDSSGAKIVHKSARELCWHASSGTRSSTALAITTPDGRQQKYWGISFTAN